MSKIPPIKLFETSVKVRVCYHNRDKYREGQLVSNLFIDGGICRLCRKYRNELRSELIGIHARQKRRRTIRKIHFRNVDLKNCGSCTHFDGEDFCTLNQLQMDGPNNLCDEWSEEY